MCFYNRKTEFHRLTISSNQCNAFFWFNVKGNKASMGMTRRRSIQAAVAALITRAPAMRLLARALGKTPTIILAPSNLGLRSRETGHDPGTWRAPQSLMTAGLASTIGATDVVSLERPTYTFEAQSGTRIRNGRTIRIFSVHLANTVRGVMERRGFPLVIGGDCSILLGGLYGLRHWGGRGLVHVDGHSDFYQMSAQDTGHLGSAAGMDLALASGRGDELLTKWPDVGVLARDEDIVQVGEREYPEDRDRIPNTGIAQITIQQILAEGIDRAASSVLERLRKSDIDCSWLHVDLDVLDEKVMPAVDSPGSPGLNFEQLAELVHALCASGRIAGADFAIYDPERDPGLHYAKSIVECITRGIGTMASMTRDN
jgi:arginase